MKRLYAKQKGNKQFKPVDWKSGRQVTNLIYASIFTEEESPKVLAEAVNLNSDIFDFELREVKDKGYL